MKFELNGKKYKSICTDGDCCVGCAFNSLMLNCHDTPEDCEFDDSIIYVEDI